MMKKPSGAPKPGPNLPNSGTCSDAFQLPLAPNLRVDVAMYLMQPVGCPPPRYAGSVTARECPNFMEIAKNLAAEINEGKIVNSRRALKRRKLSMIEEWEATLDAD